MNLRLKLLKIWFPRRLKRKKLRELYAMTALAFQKEVPAIKDDSLKDSLIGYALFTKEAAVQALDGGLDQSALKERLYREAMTMGRRLRDQLRLHDHEESREALELVYSAIQIDLEANEHDEIIVRKCFFSDHYDPRICALISSLDEGLASGLTNGARLEFTQRITEGKACCLGRLAYPQGPS